MVEEQRGDISLLDSGRQLLDILDMQHPLIALSDSIDWESIQQYLSKAYPSDGWACITCATCSILVMRVSCGLISKIPTINTSAEKSFEKLMKRP